MNDTIAFFNVDILKVNDSGTGLVFRPRVEQIVPQFQRLMDYAEQNDILRVTTACIHAGDVERFMGDDTLVIEMGAQTEHWRPIIHSYRSIFIKKCGSPDPDVNLANRSFDLFCCNMSTTEVIKALDVPLWIVFGDSADYCLRTTVEGILKAGYQVLIPHEAVGKGIDPQEKVPLILDQMQQKGARIGSIEEVLNLVAQELDLKQI